MGQNKTLKIGILGCSGLGKSAIGTSLSESLNIPFLSSKDITRPILKKFDYRYSENDYVEYFLSRKEIEFELVDKRLEEERTLSGGFVTDRTTLECFCYAFLSLGSYSEDEFSLLEMICRSNMENYTHLFRLPINAGWLEENGVRINKFLSEAGYCSRRGADRLIEQGRITVDGKVLSVGCKVMPGQRVRVDGKEIKKEEEMILLAFNKPVGIVCTAAKDEKDNIVDYIHYPKRIYPVGRLDKDSQGLILLTNNGDIVNKMMRAGNMHEKEYEVTVNHDITETFLKKMSGGVPLEELGVVTRPCAVEKLDVRKFRIILTQGYNRQIRRMCEYCGYKVVKLKRVRIMNIELGSLKKGKYRRVTAEEWTELNRRILNSSNTTVMPK